VSDTIYSENIVIASENVVLIGQSVDKGRMLTKRNFKDHQRSYDRVTFYNFYEVNIDSLDELYLLSKKMLDKPRCCFVRARLKDPNIRLHVRRNCKSEDATLVVEPFNWFALDIDCDIESVGDLDKDAENVLLALPSCFSNVEHFVVASASYGIKPGVRMRMFFWSRNAVSNEDLKRLLDGYEKIADPAIFNPVQPIYTAKPIFHDMVDPVAERIRWRTPTFPCSSVVEISSRNEHYYGAPEKWYTKPKADRFIESALLKIALFSSGFRHDGLISIGYHLGKLVGQGHFEREETILRMNDACSHWVGKHDKKKDNETIIWAIDSGIASMDKGNEHA
jgi:hypothetical protein